MTVAQGRKEHTWCDIDIMDIRCFIAFLQNGTYATASRALKMTPTNVKYRVNTIQLIAGYPLFLESPFQGRRTVVSRASLTEFGKCVYAILYDILTRYDNLVELFKVYNPRASEKKLSTTLGRPFVLNPPIPQEGEPAPLTVKDQLIRNFPGVFNERDLDSSIAKGKLARGFVRTN